VPVLFVLLFVFVFSYCRPTLRDYGDRQEEVGNPCQQDDNEYVEVGLEHRTPFDFFNF
jgi:hypothetical protein